MSPRGTSPGALADALTASPTSDERRRFADAGFFVRTDVLDGDACDALCLRLSERIAAAAAERLDGRRPALDFFSLLSRSAHGLEVFFDEARGGPAAPPDAPAAAWERRVMRVGHGLHRVDDRFRAAALAPGVGGVLASLAAPDDGHARLVQTAVVYKQPRDVDGVVQFGFHQDASYLTAAPPTLALAFVALDAMDHGNGALEVVPGSHRGGVDVVVRLGARGFEPVGGRDPAVDGRGAALLALPRGAVAFLDGRLYHGSAPNRSAGPRRALLVHAMAATSTLAPTSWIQPPPDGFTPVGTSAST